MDIPEAAGPAFERPIHSNAAVVQDAAAACPSLTFREIDK
jgi:hypothetical protein